MSSARICFPCDQSYFWEFFIDIFLLIIITIQIGHVSSRRSCSRSRSRSVRETTRSVWSSSAFEREYFAMNLNFSPSHLTKTCFLSCFKLQFRVNSGSYFLTSRTFSPAGFNAAFAIPIFPSINWDCTWGFQICFRAFASISCSIQSSFETQYCHDIALLSFSE